MAPVSHHIPVNIFDNEVITDDIIPKLLEKIDFLESSNQKLEEFAFIASHDLKEPLTMMKK